MSYFVPNMTLEQALHFSERLNKIVPNDSFEFDFSKMSNFDPLPMLVMGAIIRKYRQKYPDINFSIIGVNDSNKHYAGNMGFFKYISELLDIGKLPGEARGSSNYIPITPINFDNLQKKEIEQGNYIELGSVIEKESSRLAGIVDRGNKELHKILTYLIREILRNTPEHAKVDKAWICGQYWPTYDLAEIAIVDEGIGIFKSITNNRNHREYIKDNATALQWVLKAGISEYFRPSQKQRSDDEWVNSGFGLYMVSKICNLLKGSFTIISYGNYIEMENNKIKHGKTSFCGTAVRIRIHSSEIKNAQDIISQISRLGEEEAKSIRNSFKKASTPSKGLMNELNIE